MPLFDIKVAQQRLFDLKTRDKLRYQNNSNELVSHMTHAHFVKI